MRVLAVLLCILLLPVQASALEIQAPMVPEAGRDWMPEDIGDLSEGLWELAEKALTGLRPDLVEASRVGAGILAAALLVSVLQTMSPGIEKTADMAGTVAMAAMLLLSVNSMIPLAAETVRALADYGKLLLGVMTGALAAQGGITTSAALYAGTALFTGILQSMMGAVLVPGVYLHLSLAAASAATGEALLKRTGDLLKGFLSWCLKILLMVFTTWLSLTHVVSGTTDAAALKAAKVSMSGFVPVVGGILSDASEAVLVSAGMLKNAAGIYGILAVLAIFLHPFLRIGVHYLMLKLTGAVCGVFGSQRMTALADSFCAAMGLLLGMTGASCVMILISTFCFMKGAG